MGNRKHDLQPGSQMPVAYVVTCIIIIMKLDYLC